jgi:hypothetical protein
MPSDLCTSNLSEEILGTIAASDLTRFIAEYRKRHWYMV